MKNEGDVRVLKVLEYWILVSVKKMICDTSNPGGLAHRVIWRLFYSLNLNLPTKNKKVTASTRFLHLLHSCHRLIIFGRSANSRFYIHLKTIYYSAMKH